MRANHQYGLLRSDGQVLPPPTVCQVLHTLNVGGAELLAKQIALRAAGRFRPVFVCLDEIGSLGKQLRDEGWIVEVVERRPGFDYRCAWRLANIMRIYDVQLVHAHQYAPFFYSALARLCGRQCPILFTEHGREYPDFRRPKRVLANRWLVHDRDRIVGVGECVKSALIENEGLPANRVEVIYNGVDGNLFSPQRPDRQIVRRELSLDDHHIAVVQVARLDRLKDYQNGIRAMTEICRRCPQVRYFIVGEGVECESIAALIQDLGLHQQMVMLGLRSDVPRLLQAMDMFMLSSISEGIPLTLIEAMLSKLPSVVTRVGGMPEVVLDGQTGWLVAPQNPSEMAARLLALVSSSQQRERMGTCARARAEKLFQAEAMHAAYQKLYAELSGGSRRSERGNRLSAV